MILSKISDQDSAKEKRKDKIIFKLPAANYLITGSALGKFASEKVKNFFPIKNTFLFQRTIKLSHITYHTLFRGKKGIINSDTYTALR